MIVDFSTNNAYFSFLDRELAEIALTGGTACITFHLEGGRRKQAKLVLAGSSFLEETFTDMHGSGKQVSIHDPARGDGIELSYRVKTYDQQPFALMQLSLCNHSRDPLYLDEFCLFEAELRMDAKELPPEAAQGTHFFKVGWHGWAYSGLLAPKDLNSRRFEDLLGGFSYSNPLTPRPYSPGEFWSEGWGALVYERVAILSGIVSTARQFGQLNACIRPGSTTLRLITQADGILLEPGESKESEWGYLQFIRLPNSEPSRDYVHAVARQMEARPPASPPPAMWTHWYHFYHDITEQLFIENLDALTSQRSVMPCQVVELDDGYQSAWGDWLTTNSKFPNGLSSLADEIKVKGFTPGLWLAPFSLQRQAHLAREHPDWLVKDRHGKPVNAGFIYKGFAHALDTSHPQVQEHIRILMDTIAHRWGYGMIKADFTYMAAMPGKRYNPKMTRAECLRLGLESIRAGVGDETYLLACGCPFGPAIGIADAMRIGPDTAPSWEPYLHWAPWAKPLIKNFKSTPSLRNAVRHTLNLSTLHQRWWWNDPDCLMVRDIDTRLSDAEVQSAITLVGLSGGMVVLSDDLRKMNPDRLRWVSLLVPNLGLRSIPLDWCRQEMPEFYQAELQCSSQSWKLVGVFNWSDRVKDCRVRFEDLGYSSGATLDVFDFWQKRYMSAAGPEIIFENVPSHGHKLLRINEASAQPHIVGDTLHISQGGEITSCKILDGILAIDTIDLGRWVSGDLWIWLPRNPVFATCNDEVIEVKARGDGIYVLPVSFIGKAKIEVGI